MLALNQNAAAKDVHGEKNEKWVLLQVLNALSGGLLGTVLVDPAWKALKLKTEIANAFGIAPMQQHLLTDGAVEEISDQTIIGELVKHQDVPSLRLLRSGANHNRSDSRSMTIDVRNGTARVTWTVETQKLNTNYKTLVSPAFDSDFGIQSVSSKFKLMIYTPDSTSLKQARSRGHVQLKYDGDLHEDLNVDISVTIGNASGTKYLTPKGPFRHNFRERAAWRSSASSLQQDLGRGFDFASVAETSSGFCVCLTIELLQSCN